MMQRPPGQANSKSHCWEQVLGYAVSTGGGLGRYFSEGRLELQGKGQRAKSKGQRTKGKGHGFRGWSNPGFHIYKPCDHKASYMISLGLSLPIYPMGIRHFIRLS